MINRQAAVPIGAARHPVSIRQALAVAAPVMVGLSAVLAFAWYASSLIDQALRLQTRGYDQAFFQQQAWNISHGGGFTTNLATGNALGVHFSPFLVVPALLELLWPDARLLSILHAGALAAAGPAAYVFFRTLWPAKWEARLLAAVLAVSLPMAPFMQLADGSNFHPESFALPLALLAAAAGWRGHRRALWALALVVLTIKEDQAYTIAVVGLLLWRSRGPLASDGRKLAIASFIWGAIAFVLVVPGIAILTAPAGQAQSVSGSYYAWMLHASPGTILQALTAPEPWLRLGLMVLGLGGLPLLRPRWLVFVVPLFLASVLSAHHALATLHFHYGLLLAMPILVAAGLGGQVLIGRLDGRLQRWAATAVLPGLVSGVLFGSLPPFAHPSIAHPTSALAGLQTCADAHLPADAPVAADDNLMPPLASRHHIVLIDQATPSDYIAIDTAVGPPGWVNPTTRRQIIAGLPQTRLELCSWGPVSIWAPATSP